MTLIDKTLFGVVDKVAIAIQRLKTFEPPEGYYGAFSGGKDSVTIKELVKMAEVKCDWHYNNTTVDPPELIYFIREHHTDVKIHQPNKTMWELIVEKRMPPTRIVRYCCEELKEKGGAGRKVLTGIRWEESTKRSKRKMLESCFKDQTKIYVHPIIDWKDEDVWQFIKERNIHYCNLYDEGYKRIGCIMCPMQGKNAWKDALRWPKYYQAYLRAFQRCIDKRKKDGLKTDWDNGIEMMDWWINGKQDDEESDQKVLFE